MEIIKNSKELKKLVDNNKDLHLEDEDVRIEFEPTREELRDVYCRDLFLMDDNERFSFNGRDFNGGNFNGWDFNGWDFNGRDFNGGNFNGRDFNGWDFNGGNFNGGNFNGWNFNGRDFNGGNFNGWNFNGRDFNGRDFNGGNFNGWDFNGRDFNGGNFNGRDFNGKKVSYWTFFNCYGSIKCESIEGSRTPHAEPVALKGIEMIKPEDDEVEKAIKLLEEKGRLKDGKILS